MLLRNEILIDPKTSKILTQCKPGAIIQLGCQNNRACWRCSVSLMSALLIHSPLLRQKTMQPFKIDVADGGFIHYTFLLKQSVLNTFYFTININRSKTPFSKTRVLHVKHCFLI